MSNTFSKTLKRFIISLVTVAIAVAFFAYNDSVKKQNPSPMPSVIFPSASATIKPTPTIVASPTATPLSSSESTDSALSYATGSGFFVNEGGTVRQHARVRRVIDGDTIEIENGVTVRYIGIDTPESVKPGSSIQCYGKEASVKNTALVLNQEIEMEKDVSETDRFGRLLRYVFVGAIFVNQQLIEEGFAYASTYPPDVKYRELFSEAQVNAQKNMSGLWSVNCPIRKDRS
ncbi:MAG: thermonuclease family protein [bacterium]|nr:thermonuclease family protein [bacterium]